MKKVMSLEKCLMLLEHQIGLGGKNKALFEAVYHYLTEYEPYYAIKDMYKKSSKNKDDRTQAINNILNIIDDKK